MYYGIKLVNHLCFPFYGSPGGVEFEYYFNVSTVSPDEGSAAGGTEVTISGYGLGGERDIEVSIGSNNCEVISASYDEIVCVIVVEVRIK